MALAQVQSALAACDRRDAVLAMTMLETVHAANAPLQCGREGTSVFDKCAQYLLGLIRPNGKKPGQSEGGAAFQRMMDQARRDALTTQARREEMKERLLPHLP